MQVSFPPSSWFSSTFTVRHLGICGTGFITSCEDNVRLASAHVCWHIIWSQSTKNTLHFYLEVEWRCFYDQKCILKWHSKVVEHLKKVQKGINLKASPGLHSVLDATCVLFLIIKIADCGFTDSIIKDWGVVELQLVWMQPRSHNKNGCNRWWCHAKVTKPPWRKKKMLVCWDTQWVVCSLSGPVFCCEGKPDPTSSSGQRGVNMSMRNSEHANECQLWKWPTTSTQKIQLFSGEAVFRLSRLQRCSNFSSCRLPSSVDPRGCSLQS